MRRPIFKNPIRRPSTTDGYGKFKIELLGTGIRYVIVIPDHITLAKVHEIIQTLFKWDEDHLWDFRDECGRRYMDECVWGVHDDVIEDCIPPSKAILADVLSMRGDKLIYTFDFGDDKTHHDADGRTKGTWLLLREVGVRAISRMGIL